jgi:hypothetical protein
MDSNARGVSTMAGTGLAMSALVCCWLNSTTDNATLSIVFLGGVALCTLAAAAKLAVAAGAENKFATAADAIAGIVPFAAIVFDSWQFSYAKQSGANGFWAGFALMALIVCGAFGVWDTIRSWIGNKYRQLEDFVADLDTIRIDS